MYKEPKPMREIHEIQEKIYEEEKNLTNKERLLRIHKEAEAVKSKYGLRLKIASGVT